MAPRDAFDEILGLSSPDQPQVETPAEVLVPASAGDRAMGGGYEGADRHESSLALWSPPLKSADADILPDKHMIDGRARDLIRNDAYLQGGANLHKDNIVGAQYIPNTRPASRVIFGKQDDTWEEEFQAEVEEMFDLVADSPENWFDAQRTNTFTQLIRLAVGIHVAAGEVLSTAEWLKDGPFSTAVQIIDTDRLSTMPESMMDPTVRAGIRYNTRGAPLAYQIRTEHPNDVGLMWRKLPTWKEVPRSKPWGRLQVIHIQEQTRPDQSRGISELATALRESKFSRKFRDLNLQRAVMQAMYAAAITSELPSETVFQQLGGQGMSAEKCQEAITNYASGYLQAIAKYTDSAKTIRLDGAKIPHFFPGTKLEMLSPTQGQGLGLEFEQSLLRYIAASLGVSYEQLSRDYTSTNYSSARAAMTETWKFMQARKKLVADRFASAIFRLWLEEAINKNMLSAFPVKKNSLLYTNGRLNLKFDAIARCDWVGASRGQIDELKETQAAVLRINNGLSTYEDELSRLGKDFRKVFRQRARENKLAESLKLVFPGADPNVTNALSAEPTDNPKDKAA